MRIAASLILLILLISCESKPKMIERDLLEHGFPIVIETPDSVEIKTKDWSIQKDIVLIGENRDQFNLQIFAQNAAIGGTSSRIQEESDIVRNNPYFLEMIQVDEDGFVFSLQIDSIKSYDFRHVKVQGDQEYLFRTGIFGTFDQTSVETMYRISREAK